MRQRACGRSLFWVRFATMSWNTHFPPSTAAPSGGSRSPAARRKGGLGFALTTTEDLSQMRSYPQVAIRRLTRKTSRVCRKAALGGPWCAILQIISAIAAGKGAIWSSLKSPDRNARPQDPAPPRECHIPPPLPPLWNATVANVAAEASLGVACHSPHPVRGVEVFATFPLQRI